MSLIARIEAGTREEQRVLLREAATHIHGGGFSLLDWKGAETFIALLAIGTDEACLGAAMMLVPRNANTNINIGPSGVHAVKIVCPHGEGVGVASTPALALASACLKAQGADHE